MIKLNIKPDDGAHTFKAGHRIRIHIASSNFPNYDRNLNNRTSSGLANAEEAIKATQIVYHNENYLPTLSSNIILPVVKIG